VFPTKPDWLVLDENLKQSVAASRYATADLVKPFAEMRFVAPVQPSTAVPNDSLESDSSETAPTTVALTVPETAARYPCDGLFIALVDVYGEYRRPEPPLRVSTAAQLCPSIPDFATYAGTDYQFIAYYAHYEPVKSVDEALLLCDQHGDISCEIRPLTNDPADEAIVFGRPMP